MSSSLSVPRDQWPPEESSRRGSWGASQPGLKGDIESDSDVALKTDDVRMF